MYNQCDHDDGELIALIFYLFPTTKYDVLEAVIRIRNSLITVLMALISMPLRKFVL
jgi:hypothetical protein